MDLELLKNDALGRGSLLREIGDRGLPRLAAAFVKE
jgi:hypothetical protein